MTGTPLEIAAGDGAVLRGLCWEGSSPVLLLVHAPGEERDLDDWRPLVPYLLGEGVATVALDLRGHGASDGEWDAGIAAGDLAAAVAWTRRFAAQAVVCAAGASAAPALRAAKVMGHGSWVIGDGSCGSPSPITFAGLVLLSPSEADAPDLRGAGVPKLLLAGGHDPAALATMNRLRAISIGPALSVSLPVAAQGTELLASAAAVHLREHLFQFLRERRAEFASVSRSDRHAADLLLERLGITPKGVQG